MVAHVLALAAVGGLLAGCAASPSLGGSSLGGVDDVDITAYSDVQAVLDAESETILYPIDAFFVNQDGLDRISQANAVLIDQCMKKDGRSYPAARFDLSSGGGVTDTYYGIWSETLASQFGYEGPAPTTEPVRLANEAVIAASQADSGWNAAYESCEDSTEQLPMPGRDYISEDLRELTALPRAIRSDAGVLASSSPEWKAARAAWTACLTENGLTLRSDTQEPWSPEIPGDPEQAVRTALVDIGCKRTTALIERLSGLESRYQAALIDQHRSALNEVASQEENIVDRADKILLSGEGN